jgi:hypothetical protein
MFASESMDKKWVCLNPSGPTQNDCHVRVDTFMTQTVFSKLEPA